MKWALVVNPDAEIDLQEAKAWYEQQQSGLGLEFLNCVEEGFLILRQTPKMFGKVYRDLRIIRVRRFPYLIVYRIDSKSVTIIAVYHTRRNPRGWRKRA